MGLEYTQKVQSKHPTDKYPLSKLKILQERKMYDLYIDISKLYLSYFVQFFWHAATEVIIWC